MAPGTRTAPRNRRALALLRVVHPFPSVLDGLVVAAVAGIAGAGPGEILVLGGSMTSLQFAIGALNDLVDAPRDAGRMPPKPIVSGILSRRTTALLAVAFAAVGLALAATRGPGLLALALVGLVIGGAYDLLAKGTALSWLPFAAGIPLLPLYGWWGATGTVPAAFLVLVPVAAVAGAGLAIANALADLERDAAAGTRSIALALGPGTAARLVLVIHLLVALTATIAVSLSVGVRSSIVVGVAALVPVLGAALALRRVRAGARRAGAGGAWEVQAVGDALLAVAWLAAVAQRSG